MIAGDRLGAVEVGLEHLLTELILDVGDDRAAQGTRAVGIVKALVGDFLDRLVGEADLDAERLQPLGQRVQHQPRDLLDLGLGELIEHDDVVHTVEEFGTEHLLELAEYQLTDVNILLCVVVAVKAEGVSVLGDPARADVGGHDDDGVLEVHRATLTVRQTAVLENLQEHIEHIGMRLFDLVKEHHRIGLAAYRLSQLTAFFITDITGR